MAIGPGGKAVGEEEGGVGTKLFIADLVGIEAVREFGHCDLGGGQLLAEASSRRGTCGVAIEEEEQTWGGRQQGALGIRDRGAEKGDGRDSELGQAHDAPGILDQDDAVWYAIADAMEVEEDGSLGDAGGQLPLAMLAGLVGIEATAGVAQGVAVGVVEAHGDTALQEAAATIQAGLEQIGGGGADSFLGEEGHLGIEREPAGEGLEGGNAVRSLRRGQGASRGEGGEPEGGIPKGPAIQESDEVDDIAAALAAGEAVPEVLAAADGEGLGIVAAVEGAGPDEVVSPGPKAPEQVLGGKDLLEGDDRSQVVEVQGDWGAHGRAAAARGRSLLTEGAKSSR